MVSVRAENYKRGIEKLRLHIMDDIKAGKVSSYDEGQVSSITNEATGDKLLTFKGLFS